MATTDSVLSSSSLEEVIVPADTDRSGPDEYDDDVAVDAAATDRSGPDERVITSDDVNTDRSGPDEALYAVDKSSSSCVEMTSSDDRYDCNNDGME